MHDRSLTMNKSSDSSHEKEEFLSPGRAVGGGVGHSKSIFRVVACHAGRCFTDHATIIAIIIFLVLGQSPGATLLNGRGIQMQRDCRLIHGRIANLVISHVIGNIGNLALPKGFIQRTCQMILVVVAAFILRRGDTGGSCCLFTVPTFLNGPL